MFNFYKITGLQRQGSWIDGFHHLGFVSAKGGTRGAALTGLVRTENDLDDLVILDLSMPKMSRLDMLAVLRDNRAHPAVSRRRGQHAHQKRQHPVAGGLEPLAGLHVRNLGRPSLLPSQSSCCDLS